MKNAFDAFCGSLADWAQMQEKKTLTLRDMTTETSKMEKQREKRLEKTGQNIQELWDNYKRYV